MKNLHAQPVTETADVTVQKQYRRLAKSSDQFLYYSPRFVRCLSSKMPHKLQLEESDVFVDLGCGTGM